VIGYKGAEVQQDTTGADTLWKDYALFEENHIADYNERSVLLNKCMGVIKSFGTPEKITEKDRYELDKFAFVEGTWRLLD